MLVQARANGAGGGDGFRLALSAARNPDASGTPAYIAPEQAGEMLAQQRTPWGWD